MESKHYLLDTNMASYIIKGASPSIQKKLRKIPMTNLSISAITEAELLRGLAKKPEATQLAKLVNEFLLRVEILPWDSQAAKSYATLRTASENKGKSLGIMDMLIAFHAQATNAILVTNDQAFFQFRSWIDVEDWTV